MKKTLTLLFVLAASISTASAHWSDSYNGDNTGDMGVAATIIGFIALVVFAGIFDKNE